MRIILADHHVQPRGAIKILLSEQPDLSLVGEAVDAQDLLSMAEQHIEDLVLIDIQLPGMAIEQIIARLRELKPRPVIVTMSSLSEDCKRSLNAGADAFISKVDPSDWLLYTLNKYVRQIKKKEEANRAHKS